MTEKQSLWNRPLVANLIHLAAYLIPVVMLFGSLPSRMSAVENAQHEAAQKLDRIGENVAKIQGAIEERRQRVAYNP